MMRTILLLSLLVAAPAPALVADDTPEQLRAKMAAETDLVHRARLAVKLADLELEAARKQFAEGYPEKGNESLEEMLSHIEQAYTDLFATRRDPRKRPAGFKDTEIKLRSFHRRLDDLGSSLPLDERPPVEKVVARIGEIQEDLLNGIMHVRNARKKNTGKEP